MSFYDLENQQQDKSIEQLAVKENDVYNIARGKKLCNTMQQRLSNIHSSIQDRSIQTGSYLAANRVQKRTSVARTKFIVCIYNANEQEKFYFEETLTSAANRDVEYRFIPYPLTFETCHYSQDAICVCISTRDHCTSEILRQLNLLAVRLIYLRDCADLIFADDDQTVKQQALKKCIDLNAVSRLKLTLASVPSPPESMLIEYIVTLVLTITKNIHRYYTRMRTLNFSLNGLTSIELYKRKVGIISMNNRIIQKLSTIFDSMGCTVIHWDPTIHPGMKSSELIKEKQNNSPIRGISMTNTKTTTKDGSLVSSEELYSQSDIIIVYLPQDERTNKLINYDIFNKLKESVSFVILGNTKVFDFNQLQYALRQGKLNAISFSTITGAQDYMNTDCSNKALNHDELLQVIAHPNVICTGNEFIFNNDTFLHASAQTCLETLLDFVNGVFPMKNIIQL
ncbi:unnamed protein product [Didymodactylos carnosus]|uniref:D-isomer specific 2-hydroxyacid dehydrogenase NAD-binding domain-containing protein n=1 Tax=Didymodactylos carnosus TaxID=1234261 RepID=A0A814BID3_9BILA|nr:unnamed protein product [Didymodactylos carnosus]CAF3708152.1 unnamed protein product [Didymodactylos carnosus]